MKYDEHFDSVDDNYDDDSDDANDDNADDDEYINLMSVWVEEEKQVSSLKYQNSPKKTDFVF